MTLNFDGEAKISECSTGYNMASVDAQIYIVSEALKSKHGKTSNEQSFTKLFVKKLFSRKTPQCCCHMGVA